MNGVEVHLAGGQMELGREAAPGRPALQGRVPHPSCEPQRRLIWEEASGSFSLAAANLSEALACHFLLCQQPSVSGLRVGQVSPPSSGQSWHLVSGGGVLVAGVPRWEAGGWTPPS